MSQPKKLNSMRYLEQQQVPYEAIHFPDSIHDALELALQVGAAPHTVYKTLVVDSGVAGKPLLALIPADARLDLKKLARAAGAKKLSMASHADAEKWTGLKTGGISPLALTHKNWRVFVDAQVQQLPQFMLSAGQRGLNLRVESAAFLRALAPTLADLCAEDQQDSP